MTLDFLLTTFGGVCRDMSREQAYDVPVTFEFEDYLKFPDLHDYAPTKRPYPRTVLIESHSDRE